MNIIIDEITKVISEFSIKARVFDLTELISKMVVKYCTSDKYEYPLWDHLADKTSFYDPQAWKAIETYEKNRKKILFIEPDETTIAFEFSSSKDLMSLLENTFGFSFYITDTDLSYLICFNDHNYLIGCGEAKSWINSGCKKF